MAVGANPAMILQMLKSAAGGGAAGGATGTPQAGESVGPAIKQLQAANPDYTLKIVNDLKKQIADMIPQLAFRAPAASRALMSTFKGLDTAIKELQQAQATQNAVGGGINNSAVPQPQPPTGGLETPNIDRSASVGM